MYTFTRIDVIAILCNCDRTSPAQRFTLQTFSARIKFPNLIALSQAAPGILAVNISIFVGYKLRGTKGSIVATLGSILPSFLIILAIAIAFTGFKDNPVVIRIFKGIRPVVVALIAAPMVRMSMTNNSVWWQWAIMLAALAMTAFLSISPIYIMLCIIVMATAVTVFREKRPGNNTGRHRKEDGE